VAKINLTERLNEPQTRAVRAVEGPVLIIAGAGSGKTRVITYRIAHMLEKGIPQSAILALTFTNKAAREMESRVKSLTGKKLQSLTVSTFHAFGLSIIRDEAELLGYRKNFSVYDETDKGFLIKESMRECKIYSPKTNIYELGQFFSRIKTGLAQWTDNADMRPVYEEYNQALKIYNAVDFDDLLTVPLELFEKRGDILEKYSDRYRYILVDEFQDTSLLQYRMMRLLAGDGDANVCVVGDDDQSIYSWRGANYENLLLFEKDFPNRIEIKLEQNYRSTSSILNAANGVISHNASRKGKNLWSVRESGKPVELFRPENEKAEGEFIASQIKGLMIEEGYKYQDFGVLTRTNSLARNIEEAFLAADIPYRVSGGTSFFQRKEIKDLVSYLRVIANSDDDVSLLRIINTPRRGIGKTAIASLGGAAKKNRSSIWGALSYMNHAGSQGGLFQDHKTMSVLDEFSELIETFRTRMLERKSEDGKFEPLSQSVRSLVDKIDYWSYLVLEHGKDEKKAKWKYSNIEYFIRMIENWESDPDVEDKGLYPWLNRISLITRDDGEADAESKVSLSTIHAAKGLEFPVVFIAGAEEGLIPHERSLAEAAENEDEAGSVEEERRLFYVAITRAMERLYITSCQNRRRLQSDTVCSPSPFLEEIPQELVIYYEAETEAADDSTAEKYIELMRKKII
jgi:DNA helicase-2/ATP-dependent DNA helicase PcrA